MSSVIVQEIKSNKQYHPQMHSAEHILNQTMVRMFNCGRSFSNHIEKKKSKCDYHFNRKLTDKEIKEIESKVNEAIQKDLFVSEEFYSKEEAETTFNLSKLPDGAGDRIRIIKIGDYDACPCSGQHVSHTKQIGTFKIISTDFNDSVLRIRFKLQQNTE
jgi:misacylated tRNA(Ala) deacylase